MAAADVLWSTSLSWSFKKTTYRTRLLLSLFVAYFAIFAFQFYANVLFANSWVKNSLCLVVGTIFVYHIALAAHTVQHLFRRDAVLNIITNRILFLSDRAVSAHHFHHRCLGTDLDPDYHVYGLNPKTRLGVCRRLVGLIFLSGLIPKIARERDKKLKSLGQTKSVVQILTAHIILISISTLIDGLWLYLFGWVLPLAFAKIINDVRVFAEHFPHFDEDEVVTRNFKRAGLVEMVIGGYGFVEHATHHKMPGKTPVELGEIAIIDVPKRRGYLGTIKSIINSYPV